jgi:hypothetical protein
MSRKVLLLAVSVVLLPALAVLLDMQATSAPPQKPAAGTKAAPKAVDKPLVGGERAILEALKQPTSIEFDSTPLQQVVVYLQQMHHIPIVFDAKELQSAGVDPAKTPITCNLSGVSLDSALDLILDDFQLRWTIHHEVLLITSQARAEGEEFLITKVYDVADLVIPISEHPYLAASLPVARLYEAPQPTPPVGFRDGLAFLGYGGTPPLAAPDFDDLIDLITTTVAPKSWDANGGQGTIAKFPTNLSLVVSQTRGVHSEIAALLAELRAEQHAMPTVVVDLQWLWLDAGRYEQLLGGARPSAAGRVPLAIDAKVLEQVARKAAGFRGRIMCVNGQLVHLASGDRRSIIVSELPPDAPTLYTPNVGVVVELFPTVLPGANSALLDVQSMVTRWGKPGPTAKVGAAWPPREAAPGSAKDSGQPAVPPVPGGSASYPIDRPNMPTADLTATARVPLGKPVLLGAVTFAPADGAGLEKPTDNPVQLCLIATTSIAADAEKPAKK